jgi:hypothetical protein
LVLSTASHMTPSLTKLKPHFTMFSISSSFSEY